MDELQYLLAVLMEECAEVSQRASKGLRFTMEEVQPGQDQTNDQRLAGELNDLLAVVELIQDRGFLNDLRGPGAVAAITAKKSKVAKFMQYSRERGTLK